MRFSVAGFKNKSNYLEASISLSGIRARILVMPLFTLPELSNYQAQENPTQQKVSLRKTFNRKLYYIAESKVQKNVLPRKFVSKDQFRMLSELESDVAKEIFHKIADVPVIYFLFFKTFFLLQKLEFNPVAKTKERQREREGERREKEGQLVNSVNFGKRTAKLLLVLHKRGCWFWFSLQFIETLQVSGLIGDTSFAFKVFQRNIFPATRIERMKVFKSIKKETWFRGTIFSDEAKKNETV